MYEGAKSHVNREDYLMGKKVDKNFEKYSDVVNAEKAEVIETIAQTRIVYNPSSTSTSKTSFLQKDIIKTEDPFVAVKIREEKKRREMMENPLVKLKFQKMIKEMMTDKEKKKKKKKSKKKEKSKKEDGRKEKKKRSRSSSSSSENDTDEDDRKKKSRRISTSQSKSSKKGARSRSSSRSIVSEDDRKNRSRGDRSIFSSRKDKKSEKDKRRSRISRDRSSSGEEAEKHRRRAKHSPSPKRRRRNSSTEKRGDRSSRSHTVSRKQGDSEKDRHHKRESSSSDEEPETSRRFDSHIPAHLLSKGEDGHSKKEDAEEKPRNYGLIELKSRTDKEKERDEKSEEKSNPYTFARLPGSRAARINQPKQEVPEKRKLTEEEKQRKLREMQANAEWRDETRSRNISKAKKDDEEEDEEAATAKAPSFIRAQINSACDDLSVEKRLQSSKGSVQRSHGYMEKNFARK
ncbi:unnamed protein product [Caenorhabditis auriculariae]|uniref:Uncharacterized protein n=1 Tax=Caenorhabditis auriculariae TaxID=2777116 RepID=A0A8S1GYS6_9PELO|nr:unnamed protein product [Caenorhabditis auriculariae]